MKLATVTDVTDCKSVIEVLRKSKTDWEPAVRRISGISEHKDDTTAITGVRSKFSAIIRPDTFEVLGTCTDRYKPNNHVAHLSRLDNMVRQGVLKPTSVSVWDVGHLMAFQFQAHALDRNIIPGDTVSPLLTLAFYNDGKHGDMSFFADFRWKCTNQLGRVAKANVGNGRAAHRGDVLSKYEEMLSRQIEEMQKSTAERYRQMTGLVERKIGGKALLQYFASSLAISEPEKVVEELYQNKEDPKGQARIVRDVLGCYRKDDCGAPGSVWQAFNAVTRYTTHAAGRNAATRSARALLGSGQTVAERAFTLAMAA